MAKIILEGMLFKSFIGVHDFEQAHGNRFEVFLEVDSHAIISKGDNINETIDYSKLYRICSEVMNERHHIIETAAENIIMHVRNLIGAQGNILVRICKINPPLGGDVKKVCIEIKNGGNENIN